MSLRLVLDYRLDGSQVRLQHAETDVEAHRRIFTRNAHHEPFDYAGDDFRLDQTHRFLVFGDAHAIDHRPVLATTLAEAGVEIGVAAGAGGRCDPEEGIWFGEV